MNNQQVSQVLTFYRINFHFHDPYKFILDGNFIKLIVEREIDFKRRLENAITGKCKFYVPNCLLRELQLLGSDFKLVLEKAKQFRKISCKHALEVSVDQCIINNLVGPQNPEKYIVCSQDLQLRRQLRNIFNCPLMYFGPDQRIKFQDVQRKNVQMIQTKGKQKLLPKQNEMEQINKYKKQRQQQQKKHDRQQKKKVASQLGVKVKSKIAKKPNPLSNKKRRLREHEINQLKKQRNEKTKPIHKERRDKVEISN